MKAIYKREVLSYFMTPVGYVYVSIFLALGSLIFGLSNLSAQSGDLSDFFSMMSYIWMLLTPVLVMRLIAGERKNMTDQLLITAPVRAVEIILGKYLAACTVLLISVVLSFLYPLLIALQGKVYLPELMTFYIGFVLQGCSFVALDLMLSSFSKNPVTAAAAAFGANLFLWLATLASTFSFSSVSRLSVFFNLYDRLSPFLLGQLSFANIFFYLIFSALCLFLSAQILSARRWVESS